jgi:hypothetical protein
MMLAYIANDNDPHKEVKTRCAPVWGGSVSEK